MPSARSVGERVAGVLIIASLLWASVITWYTARDMKETRERLQEMMSELNALRETFDQSKVNLHFLD